MSRLKSLLSELPTDISKGIVSSVIEGNELRIAVRQEYLGEICAYIYKEGGASLVTMHAADERSIRGSFALYVVFSLQDEDEMVTVITPVTESFKSITSEIWAANWYEREIKDMFGLVPEGHPDPRPLILYDDWPVGYYPLRKDFDASARVPRIATPYPFRRVEGQGVFEIPVGPVHAGVIEPGHFRFSVAGEPIINLEIRLGYVHKGIEKISEKTPYPNGVHLAERISGDNSVAHSTAYCQAVEKLTGANVPERAEHLRVVFLELERIYNHFGDIAGIALDTAFNVGASHGYILKERMLQLNEALSGSRLLRSVNVLGGVRRDISKEEGKRVVTTLVKTKLEFNELIELVTKTPSFMDRVETTGTLLNEAARNLNIVGPGGRASGVDRDVRRDHPYAAYKQLNFRVPSRTQGDVNARMRVRIEEVFESMSLIEQALDRLPSGDISHPIGEIPEGRFAISLVEAPRGECVHWMMGGRGMPFRHKIRDPSFCNWPAVELAVLGDIVPDFPLVNKSFNLSYSGNDL